MQVLVVSAYARRTSVPRPAKVSTFSGTRSRASGYGHRGSPYAGWPIVPVCLDSRSIPAQLLHSITGKPSRASYTVELFARRT